MKENSIHDVIMHDGVVQEAGSNSVLVTITSSSACAGCHAEGLCNIAGKEEKTIDVTGRYDVRPGDHVTVMMQQSMGFRAIILSYLIPLIVVIASLSALISSGVAEPVAGLLSIMILIPYFLILYLFRKRINRRFTFTLKS